jgi:hypothetical protein
VRACPHPDAAFGVVGPPRKREVWRKLLDLVERREKRGKQGEETFRGGERRGG